MEDWPLSHSPLEGNLSKMEAFKKLLISFRSSCKREKQPLTTWSWCGPHNWALLLFC